MPATGGAAHRANKTMKFALFLPAAAVLLGATVASAAPFDVPAARDSVTAAFEKDRSRLEALYMDLHAHPELGFQETRTAARLAKEMKALGLDVTEGVGGTGVVAVLRNGAGPTVLVRTELDALPMKEETGLPYASKVTAQWEGRETFVAHSCGHDMHMAAWVGAARALVAQKARWRGTVLFVAQPSEETVSGARAMIADRFFERFGKPDYGFALHVGPGLAGGVYYKPGVLSSNSDALELTFTGRGGHGSMPHATIDPVLMASRFVVDVQSIVSREKDPAAFGVVTIGAIQAGSAGNIIPETAQLKGTIRTYDAGVRQKILDGVTRVAKAQADMSAAPPPKLEFVPGGKAVVNDAALTAKTADVFKQAFGSMAAEIPQPGSASEDYSEFILAGVPSVYFAIGSYTPETMKAAAGKPLPVNHSPMFAPAIQPTLQTGVTAMALAVMNVLPVEP